MKIKLSKRLVSTVLACLMVCALLPVTAFAASKTVTSSHSSKIKLTVSNTTPEVGDIVTIKFQDTHYYKPFHCRRFRYRRRADIGKRLDYRTLCHQHGR